LSLKVFQKAVHPAAEFYLPELGALQTGVEVDFRQKVLSPEAEEHIEHGIGKLPPGHDPAAKGEKLRGQIGGAEGAPLKEIFPKTLGIEALISLGILSHDHYPEVPGSGQEGLHHQGKGEWL